MRHFKPANLLDNTRQHGVAASQKLERFGDPGWRFVGFRHVQRFFQWTWHALPLRLRAGLRPATPSARLRLPARIRSGLRLTGAWLTGVGSPAIVLFATRFASVSAGLKPDAFQPRRPHRIEHIAVHPWLS